MAGKLPRASHIHVWLRKLENSWELFFGIHGREAVSHKMLTRIKGICVSAENLWPSSEDL